MSLPILILALAGASFAQTLVIRNVTLIDGRGTDPYKAHVSIARGRISSVIPAKLPVPKGAKVVDGTNRFLIPGLWDMHVHLWESEPLFRLYIVNGVVGLRDMGSDYARTRAWAKEALATNGPRVYTSGPAVDGPGGDPGKLPVIRVTSAEDGRRAADTIDSQGADFIKVMSGLSEDAYTALAQRARLRRAVFAGHVPDSVSVQQALEARQRSMEHMFGLVLSCSSEESDIRKKRADARARKEWAVVRELQARAYATFDEMKCGALLRRMATLDAYQTPTMTLLKRLSLIDVDDLASSRNARRVPEAIRKTWEDPAGPAKKATKEQLATYRTYYALHRRILGLMARMGVTLLAGTDTGDPYVLPGYSLHDELEAMVEAGLTPLQALQSATVNAARYFNIDQLTGSIGRGKSADLVLLDRDPLADIRNTRSIRAVVVRGNMLDRKELDRLLEQ